MKGIKFLIFGIFLIFAQSSFAGDMQTFIDETISDMENSTVLSNGVVRTLDLQGRRYYIGGRLNYRVPNETIQLITYNPPKISAGCGGINISLGALSYLKFDELVDKLQNAVRQSPALAVQLVISNLCEKCAAVLSFLEQVSDIINGLNMDTCSLTKAGVGLAAKKMGLLTETNSGTSAYEDAKAWLKKVQSGFYSVVPDAIKEKASSIVNGFQSGANSYDCAVITDKVKRAQCFNKMSNTLGDISKGVIHQAIALSGADTDNNTVYKDMEDILRGFIGDFVVKMADGTGKVEYIPPEPRALTSLSIAQDNAFFNLQLYPKKIDGTVGTPVNVQDFINKKRDLLKDAYDRILAGSDLTIQQKNLIGSAPVPLLAYFNLLRRLYYIDPEAANALSDDVIDKVAEYYGSIAYLNALIQTTSYIYFNIDKVRASISGAEGSEEVMSHLDSFQGLALDVHKIFSEIRKKQHADMEKHSKKFNDLIRTADKKVLGELYKYQYSAAYNFANK